MRLSIVGIMSAFLMAVPSCLGSAALLLSSGCYTDQYGNGSFAITYGTTLTFTQVSHKSGPDQRLGFRGGFTPVKAVEDIFGLLDTANKPPPAELETTGDADETDGVL